MIIIVFALIALAILWGTVVWVLKRDDKKDPETLLGVVYPRDDEDDSST